MIKPDDNTTKDKDKVIRDEKLKNENIEINLIIEAIYQKYGYDFREYAKASIKRRIKYRLSLSGCRSISQMQYKLLYNISFFEKLLLDMSINVTEMFRDPSFYLALRKKVIPVLKTCPLIKIWHAGCATGEEVYSMAILLKEEGVYEKVQIYATDFNEVVLQKARQGETSLKDIKKYTENYQKAGGTESFSDYYTAMDNKVLINPSLQKNILFSDHNLVTDWVFGEMNLIICRNVLIYFNERLQSKVYRLFIESMGDRGFLCLGSKESIRFSRYSDCFEEIAKKEKIYRKKDE